ncbi:MAG: hypothetical protein PHG58_03100 [Clostridia bacterium]|nr:hypothetical protein [Clostridia bacterium]
MKIAVWAHPIMSYSNEPEKIKSDFKKMSEAGIGIYYPFACLYGESCYPSRFVKQVTQGDLLQQIIETAGEYNIEVHPVVAFASLGKHQVKPFIGNGAPEGHASGHVACPSQESNCKLVYDIMMESIENYKIQGIHLDYIRYPNVSYSLKYPCECAACREYRINWFGKEVFSGEDMKDPGKLYKELTMRAEFIKGFVQKIRNLTSSAGIELSMAAREKYTHFALAEGQDWVEWSKEGLVDVISPMSYSPDFNTFKDFVDEHIQLLKNGKSIYFAGIGRNSDKGELSSGELIRQLQYASENGVKGCTIFHFGALTDEDFRRIRLLK